VSASPLRRFAVLAAIGIGFVALARGLPPETFFVGDPGVKLIAARNAIARPSAPLSIPLPSIAGKPVAHVEPFFFVHGDHSHAVTSEIFPLLSAPLIANVGIRGAYVLPAIGFFVVVVGCVALARTLDHKRSTTGVMLASVLGTPFLFYGLEFWEHAPAAGVAALATVFWLRNKAWAAGVLFGLAILLRPEAACYVAAVAAGSLLLAARPAPKQFGRAAAALIVVLLPLAAYSLVHFHSLLPPHISSHTDLLTDDWFATRTTIARDWFLPTVSDTPLPWGLMFPVIALLGSLTRSEREGRSFLVAVLLIDTVLVILTAPNNGGGQWGPRYLLLGFIPAAVLLSDVGESLWKKRIVGRAIVLVLLGAGAWAQRDGYRTLRTTKMIYGHVLDFVQRESAAGTTIVTDLWWLDQVAAASTDTRQFLYAAGPPNGLSGPEIVRQLDQASVPEVTVIRSRTESPDVDSWAGETCYRTAGGNEIPDRALVAIRLTRSCR